MIGSRYWSVGIIVKYQASTDGWAATLELLDDGHAGDNQPGRISTEGELRTRYFVVGDENTDALTLAIDTLKADAEKLGIRWEDPNIYAHHDGNDTTWPMHLGWRELLTAQSRRLGWNAPYAARVEA